MKAILLIGLAIGLLLAAFTVLMVMQWLRFRTVGATLAQVRGWRPVHPPAAAITPATWYGGWFQGRPAALRAYAYIDSPRRRASSDGVPVTSVVRLAMATRVTVPNGIDIRTKAAKAPAAVNWAGHFAVVAGAGLPPAAQEAALGFVRKPHPRGLHGSALLMSEKSRHLWIADPAVLQDPSMPSDLFGPGPRLVLVHDHVNSTASAAEVEEALTDLARVAEALESSIYPQGSK
ncbi:hypothetical protein F183_A51300 [Bryobacterales bacterium F-183]|nr:hypothetical protein F183_A51300 [Bryobacterales bacterium F-183]